MLLCFAEEASHSQSECEAEDSAASPEIAPASKSAAYSVAEKAAGDDVKSDESSTDVEDSEAVKQGAVHVGDGDKPDGLCASVSLRILPNQYCC